MRNRISLLMFLEVDKSKIKVQTNQVCGGPMFWITRGSLLTVALTLGERNKLSPESRIDLFAYVF